MKNLIRLFAVFFLLILVNVSFADSNQNKGKARWLEGTWMITNETNDGTYSGHIGLVTFTRDEVIIESGRFAAGGLVHNSETTRCFQHVHPISYKFLGNKHIHIFWNGLRKGNLIPQEAFLTIAKRRGKRLTLIGQGGCGTYHPRISYLEKVY